MIIDAFVKAPLYPTRTFVGLVRRRFSAAFLASCVILAAVQPADAQRGPRTAEDAFAQAFQLFSGSMYLHAARSFEQFRLDYQDHPNVPEAMYHQAEALLAAGLEDDAIELYRRFQTEHPGHPLNYDARMTLGTYYYQNRRYDDAIHAFSQLLDERPPAEIAARTLYWMGESAHRQGRTDAAMGYWQRVADEYGTTPTAALALYTIGFNEAARNNHDEAARAFEVLNTRYPGSTYSREIGLALAETYYEIGEYRRAIQELQSRLSSLEGGARDRAHFLLAESYNQLRESIDAIVYYRRFTESSPNSPYYRRAHYGLAWNYHFEGSYQWAAEHFERVRRDQNDMLAHRAMYYEAVNLKIDGQREEAARRWEAVAILWPDGPLTDRAMFERALTFYELRQWNRAAQGFRSLVDRFPNSEVAGDALRMLGETHVATGEFTRALEAYNAAIDLDAADPSVREQVVFQRAWLLYRGEQFGPAASAFEALYNNNRDGRTAPDALFWAAESYYQSDELNRAARLFNEYLSRFSAHRHIDGAKYALAWTHFRQGQYANAADQFERFLRDYRPQNETVPYRADAMLRLADSYYALKQYANAIRAYNNIRDVGADYAMYQIGQSYYHMGNSFEAIATLRNLVSTHPYSPWREEAQYAVGYMYFQNQDYDQAISEFNRLVERYPDHRLAARAQYGIGDAHYNAGRYPEAIRAYERILERYPNSPFAIDAVTGIQYVLVAQNREEALGQVVDDFAARNPDSPILDELRFRQAEVKYQSGRYEDAIADFERFIGETSSRSLLPAAYFYIGLSHKDLGRRDEAERHLRRVIDQYPTSRHRVDAGRHLGSLYLDSERYADALAIYGQMEQAAQRDSRAVAEAQYGQGMALLGMGRHSEAEGLLRGAAEQAAATTPEGVSARLGLARVYDRSGRTQEAIRIYREVVSSDQGDMGAEALYRLSVLMLQRGDARGALSELGRLSVLYAGHPEWVAQGYLAQARAYRSLGQKGDADRMYNRVISDFGNTRHAEVARREKEQL